MTRRNRLPRRLLAALFWLLVWQLAAMGVGQRILLASPLETLARLVQLLPTAAGPLLSSRSPLDPLSLRVMTAAVKGRSGSGSSAVIESPGRIVPSSRTSAKTPSLGMMQSPTRLRMAQPWWHSLPICVIRSTTDPLRKIVPTGRFLKSIPSTRRFSPKSPSTTWAPRALNSSTLS